MMAHPGPSTRHRKRHPPGQSAADRLAFTEDLSRSAPLPALASLRLLMTVQAFLWASKEPIWQFGDGMTALGGAEREWSTNRRCRTPRFGWLSVLYVTILVSRSRYWLAVFNVRDRCCPFPPPLAQSAPGFDSVTSFVLAALFDPRTTASSWATVFTDSGRR